ncbi:hypothetical protein DO628_10935 [Salmonella enterica subsp. salamae]|uniref:Uncharacterized protein n=2 Tax=Salmonella enterica TaxID=28901 RepID=A0A603L167_SALER|nr:hypothetical protein DOE60_16105 [Salmonella enterica subsp. salamae serovar 56:z10:e,n,x]EAA4082448.1 hypothetical protein [Salmonella enterica subsp. salamae serovar Sofia]EAA6248696.1 hypothetical protein [Salmonella enterica subsp. salamae]EAA8844171.1 hypothetical protein [Salmonella enterica subsp. enterica]EAM3924717.1 hypothetical protein [Salmonella enterica]EGW3959865.1 hypothetical protein [Salmonella enterica subsp. enterica serovar Enteritidis]HAC6543779.1 hypothetical protein
MKVYNRCTLFSTLSVTYCVNQFHKIEYSVSEFRVIVIMIIWVLTYFLNSDEIFRFFYQFIRLYVKPGRKKHIYVQVFFLANRFSGKIGGRPQALIFPFRL